MYVAMNMDKMNFLYAHRSLEVLSCLVWIQNPDVGVRFFDGSHPDGWIGFTLLELNLLYRNTVGEVVGPYSREKIIKIMCHLVSTLTPVDVNLFDVRIQADKVIEGDDVRYRYVKGASAPLEVETLYKDSIKVKRTAEMNAMVAAGNAPQLIAPPRPAMAPPSPANPFAKPTPAPGPAAPVAPAAPKIVTVWGKPK